MDTLTGMDPQGNARPSRRACWRTCRSPALSIPYDHLPPATGAGNLVVRRLRGVAQPGLERSVRDAEVAGSNPVAPNPKSL